VFKALVLAIIPTAAAVFILKYEIYSRLVFVSSWISALLLLSFWRILKRLYIRHRIAKGLGLIRVLLVGEGTVAETILSEIKNHSFLGFEVTGILSQNIAVGEKKCGVTVIGKYDDFQKIVQKFYIDEVFVAVNLPANELEKFVFAGRKLGCGIKIVPEGFEHIYGDFKTYSLGYLHFLEYGFRKIHGTELFIKRVIDIAGAYLGFVVLSPVFAAAALWIKIEDGGPIFYVSKRVGRKNKIFNFYKFRSMVVGADKMKEDLRAKSEVTGPIFKIKEDPRITKAGKFIRRYSIDELPQLWNVLKGDMSLVGPRPPTPDEVEKYDLWQMRRLEVKPGITCLWQVRGRSNLSFYKWVKWDLWYIDNWSFPLDMRILFWTIPAVLRKDGAY
jgi:exopolysaccharide biosynthesis polyprenyl glycosylphosphotransferase